MFSALRDGGFQKRRRGLDLKIRAAGLVLALALGGRALVDRQAFAQTAPANGAEAAQAITFDLGVRHPFFGLGAVVWPGSPFPLQELEVMKSTRMSWVRVPLINFFHESDYRPGLTVEQLEAQQADHPLRRAAEHMSPEQIRNLQAADQRTSARYRVLGENLRAAGVRFVIAALPGPPKDWMQAFRFGGGNYLTFMGGQPGQPDHRQDYLTFAVAEILAARRAGLPIAAVEFAGEPDEPGSGMRPDVANSMVGLLRKTLDGAGLGDVAIASPGTGVTYTAAKYIAAMKGEGGHIDDIKYFSVHAYDAAKYPAPAGLSRSFRDASVGTKPILVTEFNDASLRWNNPPYIASPRRAQSEEGLDPRNAANHSEYAVGVAGEALKLLSDGAAGVAIWELSDFYWMKSAYGMIDLKGKSRPTVAAFASFMKIVGASPKVEIFEGAGGPGIAATLFRLDKPGRSGFALVLANVTETAVTLKIDFVHGEVGDAAHPLAVAATYPAGGGVALSGDARSPSVVIPGGVIAVLSNAVD